VTDWNHGETPDDLSDHPIDFGHAIASLRLLGGETFDPIGLHYLEVLAQRSVAQSRPVKRILEDRLAEGLAAFNQRLHQGRRDAVHASASVQSPSKAQSDGLSNLVQRIAQHSPCHIEGHAVEDIGSRVELKSVERFRNTWSKLSASKQVTQALDQAPKNAGPINSHRLVLCSLALIRDISPDYLNRFVSYADTLLCLDRGDTQKQLRSRTATVGSNGKRRLVVSGPPAKARATAIKRKPS
jgi:hypothetical protein